MKTTKQLLKYKNKPIIKRLVKVLYKIKSKFFLSKPWNEDTESEINREFPNESEQKEVKELLKELLTRNNNLLETLNIRMLNKELVKLFGTAKLERIITDELLQKGILELSKEELQVYNYLLNYNVVDFNERIGNLYTTSCKDLNLEELQSLNEKERLKAISIILSNSEFNLRNLNELDDYYEKRKEMC